MVVVAADGEASGRSAGESTSALAGASPEARNSVLEVACRLADTRLTIARLSRRLNMADRVAHELSHVSSVLMLEHDRTALLNLILETGSSSPKSDGAGLLLVKPDLRTGDYENTGDLEYLYPVAFSFGVVFPQPPTMRFAIDDTTIVGHAANIREPVVVADAHSLPPGSVFMASKEIEMRYGYWVRPMMVVPMVDHLDRVLGVIFFVNRRSDPVAAIRTQADAERYTQPYTDREISVARALASQAAPRSRTRLYVGSNEFLRIL